MDRTQPQPISISPKSLYQNKNMNKACLTLMPSSIFAIFSEINLGILSTCLAIINLNILVNKA